MQKQNANTANYLELKIPIRTKTQWYNELCEAMQEERIPVRWQNGFYHITAVFVNDDLRVAELREAFSRVLTGIKAPSITLDTLNAFLTSSRREIIVNLAPSHSSAEQLALINNLRATATEVGANINPDFKMHITIGRVDAREATLDDVRRIISTIDVSPMTVPVKDINYLYLSNHAPIARWTLE